MDDKGGSSQISSARDVLDTMQQISELLETGLDSETLSICVHLCELGVNPEALASVIKELRREMDSYKSSVEQSST